MACSGVSPSEWQPGRSGYSIKNPPPSSDDSGRIVNGYLSILANSFMLGIRSAVRRLPGPPYASCGHSSAFPQGFSWRWTRFHGTGYGASEQYRRAHGSPRRFSANSMRALGSTGCLAVKWDLSKVAFDEPPNPLGRDLARGRGVGRPTRTREEPDQGVRRGRGRPPHCGTNCQPPFQNTRPTRAINVRGCRKCVPLNVERKLYSATLLVMLAMSKDAVNFSRFSV